MIHTIQVQCKSIQQPQWSQSQPTELPILAMNGNHLGYEWESSWLWMGIILAMNGNNEILLKVNSDNEISASMNGNIMAVLKKNI